MKLNLNKYAKKQFLSNMETLSLKFWVKINKFKMKKNRLAQNLENLTSWT